MMNKHAYPTRQARPACTAYTIKLVLVLAVSALLTPRAAQAADPFDYDVAPVSGQREASVRLPLISGWFQGRVVQYITTDVSDQGMAKAMGANFAPRLAYAIPSQPRTPGQPSALERIYAVTNFKQATILPSLPEPVGPNSADKNYSPLWLRHEVSWLPGFKPRLLRSEEEILSAEEQGQVAITPTNIVVNCPVIFSEQGGLLPGAKIISR